jgi:polyisoprenoid-binding protein YceI
MYLLNLLTGFLLFFSHTPSTTTFKNIRAEKTSTLTYHMVHPLHSWTGTSNDVQGVLQYDDAAKKVSKVAILAKVSSFDSKNSNRDSHMLEVTEALKYPNVSFSSTSVSENGNHLVVKGLLTFHGVAKEISFNADQQQVKGQKVVDGSFTVQLDQFKIERPSLMMMPVENDMKIDFHMVFPV